MEQEKNKKGLTTILVVIIIGLLALVILLGTGTISFKSNDSTNESPKGSNGTTENYMIDSNIEIENVYVFKDGANEKISVEGTVSLTYDDNVYKGATISGYCYGADNEKYIVSGPGDGRTLFDKSNSKLSLVEDVNAKIVYIDGTIKEWSDINWSNVKIKSCTIDMISVFLRDDSGRFEKKLNVEKNF